MANINHRITSSNVKEVNRITNPIVIQALKRLKPNKGDAVFDFHSDCLIEGPKELTAHLTCLLKLIVMHGTVPPVLLMCNIIPLVKDSLGDTTSSNNYRSIATGCQVLKLLDLVILLIEGDKLAVDQLQFGFQAEASTTMCTWMASSVIEQYNRGGSNVYGCAMDLTKAFDMVEWLELEHLYEPDMQSYLERSAVS